MTALELKAINMIGRLSEDKVSYIIDIMEDLNKGVKYIPKKNDENSSKNDDSAISEAMQAVQNLQKYRKQGTKVIDYKEELSEILEERYRASFS